MKKFLRNLWKVIQNIIGLVFFAGSCGSIKSDAVRNDPTVNGIVIFAADFLRTVFWLIRNYPIGCIIALIVLTVLRALLFEPDIERQKHAYENRRKQVRSRPKGTSQRKRKRKGNR